MSSVSFKILGYIVILCSALMANAVPKAGEVTWYDPKSVMSQTGVGACGGEPIDKTMPIAALAKAYFDSYPGAGPNPNANPLCGKRIRVTIGGKSVTVTVRDRCDSCEGPFDVDLSQTSFAQLTDPGVGRLGGTWDFVNPQDDIGMKPGNAGGAPGAPVPRADGRDSTNPGFAVRRKATDTTPRRMKKVKSGLVKVSKQTKRDEVVDKVKKREEPEKRPRRLSRVMRGIVLDDRN